MSDSVRDSHRSAVYSTVYTSAEATPFSSEHLTRLLTHSRIANEASGVTGVLLYRRGRFVQYLEGDETVIRALVRRISTDSRHRGVRVLIDTTSKSRHFPHWTMGFVTDDSAPAGMPIGFRTAFNDIDKIDDDADAAALRALRELSLWFRKHPDVS